MAGYMGPPRIPAKSPSQALPQTVHCYKMGDILAFSSDNLKGVTLSLLESFPSYMSTKCPVRVRQPTLNTKLNHRPFQDPVQKSCKRFSLLTRFTENVTSRLLLLFCAICVKTLLLPPSVANTPLGEPLTTASGKCSRCFSKTHRGAEDAARGPSVCSAGRGPGFGGLRGQFSW